MINPVTWLRDQILLCPQEPTAEEFEDKDWTFLVVNVSLCCQTQMNVYEGWKK